MLLYVALLRLLKCDDRRLRLFPDSAEGSLRSRADRYLRCSGAPHDESPGSTAGPDRSSAESPARCDRGTDLDDAVSIAKPVRDGRAALRHRARDAGRRRRLAWRATVHRRARVQPGHRSPRSACAADAVAVSAPDLPGPGSGCVGAAAPAPGHELCGASGCPRRRCRRGRTAARPSLSVCRAAVAGAGRDPLDAGSRHSRGHFTAAPPARFDLRELAIAARCSSRRGSGPGHGAHVRLASLPDAWCRLDRLCPVGGPAARRGLAAADLPSPQAAPRSVRRRIGEAGAWRRRDGAAARRRTPWHRFSSRSVRVDQARRLLAGCSRAPVLVLLQRGPP